MSRNQHKYQLTEREFQVLHCIVSGLTNIQIGKKLLISPHTAKFYVSSILDKMKLSSRLEIAVKAIREELIIQDRSVNY